MKLIITIALLVAATPAFATPKPEELNLTIGTTTPLIWNYRRAEIEAAATESIRNGVEPSHVRALIRTEAAKSPTRTYKYSELDRLVDSIYFNAKAKANGFVIVRGQND